MLVRVAAVQARMGQELTLAEKIHLFKLHPDFVCLPEYYLLGDDVPDHQRAALKRTDHLKYLAQLSDELSTCLIGGTVVEARDDKLYNACYVFDSGRTVGKYYKQFPVPGELERGISPGDETVVISIDGVRVGLMVCGDVFYPSVFEDLGRLGADLIFIPTTSPLRENDTRLSSEDRDRKYFVDGSLRSAAYVIKSCGVGRLFGKPLQGRSLIAAPWGILRRVDRTAQDSFRIVSTVLDIADLREFKAKATGLATIEWRHT